MIEADRWRLGWLGKDKKKSHTEVSAGLEIKFLNFLSYFTIMSLVVATLLSIVMMDRL